jgi:hypothetical protein
MHNSIRRVHHSYARGGARGETETGTKRLLTVGENGSRPSRRLASFRRSNAEAFFPFWRHINITSRHFLDRKQASRTMTTPQQRNLISSAGFIGLVAAVKAPAETYVKCNQVRLRASRSRST